MLNIEVRQPAAEVGAMKAQLDKLLTLPAAPLAADDARAGAERWRLLAEIEGVDRVLAKLAGEAAGD